jgi:hypothetical protein
MIFVPDTGDRQLNLVLEQLASNVGNVTSTSANAVVYNGDGSYSAGGSILGYRNRWMYVIFSDDAYGTDAQPLPTNKNYYGIVNTATEVFPTNELSYSYTQVSGGFGTTKTLYYKTTGGRNIQWQVATTQPGGDWVAVPNTSIEYVAIDLDTITVATGTAGANGYSSYQASIFQSNSNVPTTPSGGSYTFSTKQLVTPTGWYSNVPSSGTNNVYVASYLFSSNVADNITAGAWSAPTAVFRNGTNGSNGANGSNGVTTTVGTVFQANSSTPIAISSSGYYNFATSTLVAPSDWSSTIPNNSANLPVWSSMATFVTSNSTANVANTTPWTTPAMTFQSGSVGAPGTRGIIPLAYVVTSGNPTIYTDTQLTNDFSASRTNPIAPIGTGYAPITGDTAQFVQSGGAASVVKSYNGSIWTTVVGEVIDGSLIVTGTVTATQLKANDVYALSMRGGSVTGPDDTGNVGYFLNSGTGSALFTGNVTVGNLITAGSLAPNSVGSGTIVNGSITGSKLAGSTITGNLIAGSTITGNLIAGNTITGNLIANGSITADKLAANVIQSGNVISFNANIGNNSSPGYWLRYDTGEARFGGNISIGGNLTVAGLVNGSTLTANTVATTNIVYNAVNDIVYYQNETAQFIKTDPVIGTGYNIPGVNFRVSIPYNATSITTLAYNVYLRFTGTATSTDSATLRVELTRQLDYGYVPSPAPVVVIKSYDLAMFFDSNGSTYAYEIIIPGFMDTPTSLGATDYSYTYQITTTLVSKPSAITITSIKYDRLNWGIAVTKR